MPADGVTPSLSGGHLLGDRYRLLEKIGEGGAAEVFRAKDQRLDRIVAIKLLRPQFTSDEQSRHRFSVEARAAAGLSHPNIVDVYDFGEAPDGSMFIVMQYVEGKNLKDILQQRGRMSTDQAVSIAQQVCHALSVAHAKGLIHRDVKPQNIMIDQAGNVRLTDFGVVKALSGPALTMSGMTFGTAAYLSPEQATGATIGPPSDIYALGCVMYEMLAGIPPFSGDSAAVVAYKQVWEQPRPLHDLVPEVPPSLEAVVMRCLNKEPDRRYPTTEALAAELARINTVFTQPTQAVPMGVVAPPAPQDGGPRESSEPLSASERSQAIPMPIAPGGSGGPVPPVRAQTTYSNGATVLANPAPVQPATAAAAAAAVQPRRPSPYAGRANPVQVVTVSQRRSVGWVPLALVTLLALGLCGLGAWQGRAFLGIGGPGAQSPTPQPTAQAEISPTPVLGGVVEGSPVTAPPTAVPTDTPLPPTETPVPLPTDTPAPLPTDTPAPPPPPTDTPVPEQIPPPLPTDTPVPEPEPPTPTPAPEPLPGNTIALEDTAFAGGYTRSNGLYHGRSAHWVYGQGTQYSTMSATFNVDNPPAGPAVLTIVGIDSEDKAKTPMNITLNGVVIYEGPNPLPNDNSSGPNGPGNWGSFTWPIGPGVLQPGANTLSITNLDPSPKINFPIFIMVDYASISWGP
jgi:eukaryotic-like serine/threonine-protein kinase